MQYAIPDDWDGESWRCIQIQWPDSYKWQVILISALSEFFKGRVWNAQTGTIKTVQETGRDIWAKNEALAECDDCPDCPDCPVPVPTIRYIFISDDESESDDMSGPKVWIDYTTCELVVDYGGCNTECRFPLQCSTAEPADSEDPIDPAPEGDHFACAKAKWAVDFVFRFAQSIWDQSEDILDFTPWGDINSDNPGVSYNKVWAGLALSQAIGIRAGSLITGADWDNDCVAKKQELYCKVVSFMTPDDVDNLADADNWSQFESWISNMAGTITVWGLFWRDILKALGQKQIGAVSVLHSDDDTADCDCPAEADPEMPTGFEWVYSFDFTEGLNDWTLIRDGYQDSSGIYDAEPTGQYNFVEFGATINPEFADGTTKIKYAKIFYNIATGWGKGTNDYPLSIRATPDIPLIPGGIWGDNVGPGDKTALWTDSEGETLTPDTLLGFDVEGYQWYNNAPGGRMTYKRIVVAGDGKPPFTDLPV